MTQTAPGKSNRGWSASPLSIALVGLVGTAIGWVAQGYQAITLERQKFQSTLIQNALAAPSQEEASKRLEFLNNMALISVDREKIRPGELPIFRGAALRDRMITVRTAKELLKQLRYFDGHIDDEADDLDYQIGLMRFQRDQKLDVDALLGPKTLLALWEVRPEFAEVLRRAKREGASSSRK